MKAADESSATYGPSLGILTGILRTVKSILTHDSFGKCTSRASRRSAHLLAFYGFAALFAVTVWAVIDLYVMPYVLGIDSLYPFSLLHPVKLIANVGALLLIVGCVKVIVDRIGGEDDSRAGTAFDWIFIWLLLSVGITGLLTEVFRLVAEPSELAGLDYIAFAVYFVHLVLVFGLLVYLPYSKFAHMLYRTVALVYAERSGRSAPGGPDRSASWRRWATPHRRVNCGLIRSSMRNDNTTFNRHHKLDKGNNNGSARQTTWEREEAQAATAEGEGAGRGTKASGAAQEDPDHVSGNG
jgi:nitrate reductase gamma subunit